MAKYEEHAQGKVVLKASLKAVYGETTYKRIEEDAIFFRRKAAQSEIDDQDKKRYARIVILLMALYLESFSILIFNALVNKPLNDIDNRTHLPGPIRRFRAVHKELLNKELALNTDGIQDIFTIRNKIVAHPAGRAESQTGTGEDGWSRLDKNVAYKKFRHFPVHYSHFTLDHTDEILKEVKGFTTAFLKMLSVKVPKKQFDEWWPCELGRWSEAVSKQ